MEMNGSYTIQASRQEVWDALNAPVSLQQAIPGCDSLEHSGEDSFVAAVTVKVGPVKAKFKGKVALSEINAPNSYRITGEGQGGAAGFAKGGAFVELTEDGKNTILTYKVEATIGGKLAQIGQRLVDSTAKKMANEFFTTLAANIKRVDSPDVSVDDDISGEKTTSNNLMLKVSAAIVVGAIILFFLNQ